MQTNPGQPTPEESQLNAAILTQKYMEAQKKQAAKPPEPPEPAKDTLERVEPMRHENHREHRPKQAQQTGFLIWLMHKLNIR